MDLNQIKQQLAQLSEAEREAAIKELAKKPKRGWAAHFTSGQEIQVGPVKGWVEHSGPSRMVLVLEKPAPKEE